MNTLYERPDRYDFQYLDYRADISFMLWLAENYAAGASILEMACGTMRITIELAKAGFDVVGVDLSQPMLSYGLEKLQSEKLSSKVQAHLGDMRNIQLLTKGHHRLAVVPFTAFLHLITQEDQLQALSNIRDHLLPDGYFLADIFNPDPNKLNRGLALEKEVIDEDNDERLLRWNSSQYEAVTETARWTFICEIFNRKTGESKQRFFEDAIVSIIFPEKWRTLLNQSGFTIVNEWGFFDRSSFDDKTSPRQLFLCKKS